MIKVSIGKMKLEKPVCVMQYRSVNVTFETIRKETSDRHTTVCNALTLIKCLKMLLINNEI